MDMTGDEIMDIAGRVARRFGGRRLEYDDARQIGAEALIRASRWPSSRRRYAYMYCRGALKRAVDRNGTDLRADLCLRGGRVDCDLSRVLEWEDDRSMGRTIPDLIDQLTTPPPRYLDRMIDLRSILDRMPTGETIRMRLMGMELQDIADRQGVQRPAIHKRIARDTPKVQRRMM